jgi:hypothetical protein
MNVGMRGVRGRIEEEGIFERKRRTEEEKSIV